MRYDGVDGNARVGSIISYLGDTRSSTSENFRWPDAHWVVGVGRYPRTCTVPGVNRCVCATLRPAYSLPS